MPAQKKNQGRALVCEVGEDKRKVLLVSIFLPVSPVVRGREKQQAIGDCVKNAKLCANRYTNLFVRDTHKQEIAIFVYGTDTVVGYSYPLQFRSIRGEIC